MASYIGPIVGILLTIGGIYLGKAIALRLDGSHRMIVSGFALMLGLALFYYGIISLNSESARTLAEEDLANVGGIVALGFGGMAVMIALFTCMSPNRVRYIR